MVVIVLIVLVVGVAGTFLNFSMNLERKSEEQYDLQADARYASEVLNNAIRNSSVTFTLSKETFAKAKKPKVAP